MVEPVQAAEMTRKIVADLIGLINGRYRVAANISCFFSQLHKVVQACVIEPMFRLLHQFVDGLMQATRRVKQAIGCL